MNAESYQREISYATVYGWYRKFRLVYRAADEKCIFESAIVSRILMLIMMNGFFFGKKYYFSYSLIESERRSLTPVRKKILPGKKIFGLHLSLVLRSWDSLSVRLLRGHCLAVRMLFFFLLEIKQTISLLGIRYALVSRSAASDTASPQLHGSEKKEKSFQEKKIIF